MEMAEVSSVGDQGLNGDQNGEEEGDEDEEAEAEAPLGGEEDPAAGPAETSAEDTGAAAPALASTLRAKSGRRKGIGNSSAHSTRRREEVLVGGTLLADLDQQGAAAGDPQQQGGLSGDTSANGLGGGAHFSRRGSADIGRAGFSAVGPSGHMHSQSSLQAGSSASGRNSLGGGLGGASFSPHQAAALAVGAPLLAPGPAAPGWQQLAGGCSGCCAHCGAACAVGAVFTLQRSTTTGGAGAGSIRIDTGAIVGTTGGGPAAGAPGATSIDEGRGLRNALPDGSILPPTRPPSVVYRHNPLAAGGSDDGGDGG